MSAWQNPVIPYSDPGVTPPSTGMKKGSPIAPRYSGGFWEIQPGDIFDPSVWFTKEGTGGWPTFQDFINFVSGVASGGGYLAPPGYPVVKPNVNNVTPSGPVASPGAGKVATAVPSAVAKAPEAIRKALKIDPADWQTFIRQTATDWGVWVGLGVLGILGLVFLVSAAGGGTIERPLSPYSAPQRIRKTLTGGGKGRRIASMKK